MTCNRTRKVFTIYDEMELVEDKSDQIKVTPNIICLFCLNKLLCLGDKNTSMQAIHFHMSNHRFVPSHFLIGVGGYTYKDISNPILYLTLLYFSFKNIILIYFINNVIIKLYIYFGKINM